MLTNKMSADIPAEKREKALLGFVLLSAVLVHIRSFDVYFYNDDLLILRDFLSRQSSTAWLFAPVNDHIILIPKLFYALFFTSFGLSTLPWHLLIIFIHLSNVILIHQILKHAAISMRARIFAVACFAITTVFHECIYWIGASTFLLCLPFCLASVLAARRAEERASIRWLLAVSLLITLATFCVSTGIVAVMLVPLSLLSMPQAKWSKARAVGYTFLFSLLGCVPFFALSTRGSARQQFDPVTGTIFTARSIVERLTARYFTGGSLPLSISWILLIALLLLALWSLPEKRSSRWKILIAPLSWIILPTWLILIFRSWMGEVVFVSRYQLFPAVGFTWLLALATDAVIARFRFSKMNAILWAAIIGLFAVQLYASKICNERWLERTEGLKQSHQEITSALKSLIHQWKMPLLMSNHTIAGGQGWRPDLQEFTKLVVADSERQNIKFVDAADLKCGLDSRLLPLVNELRSGKRNWLFWMDDLSVTYNNAPNTNEKKLNAAQFFAQKTGGRFSIIDTDTLHVEPQGIGYVTQAATSKQNLSRWRNLRMQLHSAKDGEVLLSFGSADYGARVRTPAGKDIAVSIDVPLANRGPISDAGVMIVTFTNTMTSYDIAKISIACDESCE